MKRRAEPPPLICCNVCDGTGKVDLSTRLNDVLNAIPFDNWRTTTEIGKLVRINRDNACNALANLKRLGFVRRRGGAGRLPISWRRNGKNFAPSRVFS